jgi:hypothetical protein
MGRSSLFIGIGRARVEIKVEASFDSLTDQVDDRRIF